MNRWRITLRAAAYVEIVMRDSSGDRVSLDAEFQLLDAATAEPLDFVRDTNPNASKMSIKGWVLPGRVVPVLVTSDVIDADGRSEILRRNQWFSRGLDFDQAKVWSVLDAESSIEFDLPEALDPVTINLNIDGLDLSDGPRSMGLVLLGSAQPGESPQPRYHGFFCSSRSKERCHHVLDSIPGQTWRLRANGYRINESDRSTILFQPQQDAEINVVLEPR